MAATRTDVITLHGFGPFLGTPDSSPFVIKVMLLLKFASLPFRTVQGNPLTAPHRLLPTRSRRLRVRHRRRDPDAAA
jgi:hypothetical protein